MSHLFLFYSQFNMERTGKLYGIIYKPFFMAVCPSYTMMFYGYFVHMVG